MQLKIFINLKEPLSLPINYNHILQGAIYNTCTNIDKKYTAALHDSGINNSDFSEKNFKFFSFSKLIGKYQIADGYITFYNSIFFEVRSVNSYFIHILYEGISNNGIRLKSTIFHPKLKLEDKIITDNSICIKMLSPIVAIDKDESGKTNYLSPLSNKFIPYLYNNFKSKYESYYNNLPKSEIEIILGDITNKDKCVTKFKNIFITAWNGTYFLNGEPEYLNFLYNVGLGSKNSQGFGLFNIVEE